MLRLFIDIETYSETDISEAGAFRYIESPSFGILLCAFAFGDEPVRVIDWQRDAGSEDAKAVLSALRDPEVVKVAHNCAFERAAFARELGEYMPPEQWEDTMILAAMNGLPLSLDAAGEALDIGEKKLREGKALIRYFCSPCAPTKANGGRTRNLPEHAPDKWELFTAYCARDVEACRAIHRRLPFSATPQEKAVFALDARINERGVLLDRAFAEAAVAVNEVYTAEKLAEMRSLTGLENPNSVAQLKAWLSARGLPSASLDRQAVSDLLAKATDPKVKDVLRLRKQLGKTSVTKYEAMLASVCEDGRIRGLLQYYGTRTGRWAGRLVQLQNLPQNHLDHLPEARELVMGRDPDLVELLYGDVPDVLSQLIRTSFVAPAGQTLLVADYSAIEARVVAYLAGEQWRLDTFRNGGDIYCASASKMFHVPVEKHGVNGHLRQKGKIAELALGYGGGVNALIAFGADRMGMLESEMREIVDGWRAASPNIVRLWQELERAAKNALRNPGRSFKAYRREYDPARARENEILTDADRAYSPYFRGAQICAFRRDRDALRMTLPSGRVIAYWGAREDEDGGICYMGVDQTTRRWEKTSTWGGKLTENLVQSVARDCLAAALLRLDRAGWRILFHVHDEVICEAPEGARWQDMAAVMTEPVPWAPGLPLAADGYSTPFYRKD